MKINKFLTLIISLVLSLTVTVSYAQTNVSCKDSYAPRFLCEAYSDITHNLSFSNIIRYVIYFLIFTLIIFSVIQIIRAIFSWVAKSNDDKARQGALRLIGNAAVGVILTIVLVIASVVFFGAGNMGDVINPDYACYPSNVFYPGDLDLKNSTLNPGVYKDRLPNTDVFETKSVRDAYKNGTETPTSLSSVNETAQVFSRAGTGINLDVMNFRIQHLYCVDRATGNEHPTGYVILPVVTVNK